MSSTTRDDYEVPTTVAPQKGESEMGTHPFSLLYTRDDIEVPTTVAPQKGESEMGTHPFLLPGQED